jgi:hypothetical protein
LGYNDRVLARRPPAEPITWASADQFHPGDMKYDYDYSIDVLKPDIVLQMWKLTASEQRELLLRKGFVFVYVDGDQAYWFRAATIESVRRVGCPPDCRTFQRQPWWRRIISPFGS